MQKENILDEKSVTKITKILRNHFINLYKVLLEVDPKEGDLFQGMNHAYHEKLAGEEHKCEDVMRHIYIPKQERTFYQQELADMISDFNFREILPQFLDYLGKKFKNIKAGGKQDKLEWNEEAEKFVLTQVLKQGVSPFFVAELKKRVVKDSSMDAKQPMLVATPASWREKFPKIKLDFLVPETIKGLLDEGFSIQPTFIDSLGFFDTLCTEVMYFYHEGRFEAPPYSDPPARNDRFLNFSLTQLDEQSTPKFYSLCKCLTALPFELNMKSNLYVQVSEAFQLSYYKQDGGFQKAHIDSSFEKNQDTGKKVSVMILFSESLKNKLTLKIYKPNSVEVLKEMELKRGNCCILKSRVHGYEFENVSGATFVLRYWITGPPDTTKLLL